VNAVAELSATLQSMRDVPGVQGSFVVSDFGRLLARDMPAMFGDDILGEAGPRALRLRETLSYGGQDVQACTLRYGDFLVFVRPLRDGLLCVLAGADINPAVMKMAMNLAIRRLNALLSQSGAQALPPATGASATPAAPARLVTAATGAVRPPPLPANARRPHPPRPPGPPTQPADPTTRVVETQEIPFPGSPRSDAGDRTIVRMYRGRPVRE
jgi:predicted regulator of Ras-like GTPase activity (Roadblock/LC7/MglB family)